MFRHRHYPLLPLLTVLLLFLGAATPSVAQNRVSVSGFITDAKTGEPLIGAMVVDTLSHKGVVTNKYGYYTLPLVAGEVVLNYYHMGYIPHSQSFTLTQSALVDIRLEQDTQQIQASVVTADKGVYGVHGSQMSAIEIPVHQIKSIPAFGGEADIIKALQMLPGVQSGNEGSAGLYIRGGGPDENLLLLDGVPLYNVNHAMGIFSVFDADVVKNVTLYKGSFPARFGSRLSGVVDVRQRDGNDKEFHWGFTIGLLASKFSMEGPLVKEKTSFSLSLRRTYFDLFATPAFYLMSKAAGSSYKPLAGYYFYDFNGKLTHKVSNHDKLFLSIYTGDDSMYANLSEKYNRKDEIHYQDGTSVTLYKKHRMKMGGDWDWGNRIVAAGWNHVFSPELFMNTTLNYSRYRHNLDMYRYESNIVDRENSHYGDTTSISTCFKSLINDISLSSDYEYKPAAEHEIRFGANAILHAFDPSVTVQESYDSSSPEQSRDTTMGDPRIRTIEASLYAEDDWALTDWLKVDLGFRGTLYRTRQKTYGSLEPRMSCRFLINDNLSVKASYVEMSQYLHLLSNSSLSLPTDLWIPVTDRIAPMRSRQVAAGVFYLHDPFDFSVEAYYKTMDNVVEYREGTSLLSSVVDWEDKVAVGRGWAYGAEFLIRKTMGNTTGWLGYTWSKTTRQFDREGNIINFGEPFPAKYDRRHDVNLVVNHRFNRRIDFSGSFVFGSGICGSLPLQQVLAPKYTETTGGEPSAQEIQVLEQRNNYRLPPSHRLDLALNFHKTLRKGGERTISLCIYNVYNHVNPMMAYIGDNEKGYVVDSQGHYYYTNKAVKIVSIFPIMPSISWNYKF